MFHSWQTATGCRPGPNASSHAAAQPYLPSTRNSVNCRSVHWQTPIADAARWSSAIRCSDHSSICPGDHAHG